MNLKKVITGNELKEHMKSAINLLCNTVKNTLGPEGNNVIIDHSSHSPYITNDGVTIAQNIESDDPIDNTILELAKEASLKTNENVGDGTTTTLILLQSIFNNGLSEIEQGINPLTLKINLDIAIDKIISEIKKLSRKPTKKELLNIATISANDLEIGKELTASYLKVKKQNAIKISEGDETFTTIEHLKGYTFTCDLASPYFLLQSNYLIFYNAKILLVNDTLSDLNNLAILINEIIKTNASLIIIAKEYSNNFVNQVTELYLNNSLNICLLKLSEYGINELNTLNDINTITNSQIFSDEYSIDYAKIKTLEKIKITKDEATISFTPNKNTKILTKKIIKELKNNNDEISLEFNQKRISMLQKGLIDIKVGATTTTERREKKMRFDDALCALGATTEGIIPGSGLTLYKISETLEQTSPAKRILTKALKEPLCQILKNAGVDTNKVINNIKSSNYQKIYNVKNKTYELVETTTVIDPTKVVINALKNASSIATMLLTTSCLVINEYKTTIKKDEYNEI